jgi:prepilin-type N-terminal cleavage/methylation domain-containing protein
MDRQEDPVVKRSATCHRVDEGFTLIELVVALAVVGLALTFVLPSLTAWVDRLAFSMRQQQFEDALAELGSKARRNGRTVVLKSTGRAPQSAGASPIELPSSWALTVEPPISFRYDGICTGGTVRLNFPSGDKSYRLPAPYCRPEPM